MQQIVYVTSPESQQIHVHQMDNQGTLTLLQVVDTPGKGQPMAIHPAKTHLYIGIRPACGIVSYRIDERGLLSEVGMASLPGSPTQLTTDCQGTTLYSASYTGCSLSVSPINAQGIVGAPQQTLKGLAHCHSANVDTTNQVLWVPCLQEDRIRLYSINESGISIPLRPMTLSSGIGAGPRHMVFHRGGEYAYAINERSGTVNVIAIDTAGGGPHIAQTLDIMPASFSDTRWAADIHITPNARWLYCCERTASIISRFAVSEDGGTLSLLGHHATESQPRSFNIDNQGRFLVAAGQTSHHIAVYAIDVESGELALLDRYAVGQGPMWVSILRR